MRHYPCCVNNISIRFLVVSCYTLTKHFSSLTDQIYVLCSRITSRKTEEGEKAHGGDHMRGLDSKMMNDEEIRGEKRGQSSQLPASTATITYSTIYWTKMCVAQMKISIAAALSQREKSLNFL